ncbi:MAG: hypothetical protein ACLQUY_20055 [Ktedonobacterales bacterium]
MADSDLSEAEQLSLLFKAGGIDVVKDAGESFHSLTEEMKGTAKAAEAVQEDTKEVDAALKQANEVLREGSTVVADLKQKIAELTSEQDALRDSFISGLVPSASRFKEQFDALGDSIRDKQGILERATGEGEGEGGKGGFAGLAGGVMKAEKAIHSLASGSGLGRLGGMLESVLGPLGVPGLGMALGALAYELEPLIPKIKEFSDAWEMGVKKMNDATEAIERLNRAQGEARQKRALGRIEGQITTLEDLQDTQGFLSAGDTLKLRRLREAAWTAEQGANEEQANQDRLRREEKERREADRLGGRLTEEGRANEEATRKGTEKEAHDALEARRKRVEHQQRVEDEGIIQQADEQDRAAKDAARQADRQAKDRDRAQAQAQRQDERAARENLPEAAEHRALAAQRNEEMGIAQQVQAARAGMGDVMASQMGPGDLQQVVAAVGRNRTLNSSLGFTLAQQVNYYMSQLEAKMVADFTRGMGQQNRPGQNVTPFGGL